MVEEEDVRFGVVEQYRLVNFKENKELSNLVRLAIEICDVPIGMITLMGKELQWIVSAIGTSMTCNSIEKSFCKYLINENEMLVVQDATIDVRFNNNELVVNDPYLRFYAGLPLISDNGFHVGSFCLFDVKPHELTDKQKSNFILLSQLAIKLLDIEITLAENKSVNAETKVGKEKTELLLQRLKGYFDSSPSLHILLDLNMKVMDFNKQAFVLVKKLLKKGIEQDKSVLRYIPAEYTLIFRNLFQEALKGKRVIKEIQAEENGKMVWWKITLRPVFDTHNQCIAIAYSAMNINESKLQFERITSQNESLLRIAYIQSHEYRRPLASIMGLMNVIVEDDFVADKECLTLMNAAVSELDQKIRKVVTLVESVKGITTDNN